MDPVLTTDFGDVIADLIRVHHRALATRWFERLLALLPVEAREVFPSESMLDHIPALILAIGDGLRCPDQDAVAANTAILEKAHELGALRHAQRASLHQVLREYQILSAVLVTFVVGEMEHAPLAPPPADTANVVARLHAAVNVLAQATVETFVTLYTDTIARQTARLEEFTRMAAHEWRQPLGALQFGLTLLRRPDLAPERAGRTWDAVERTVNHLIELTHKLETVARMHGTDDSVLTQNVSLTTVASEAARQLRDMADARGVDVTIAPDLPCLTIDVGRLELVLVNLLSNAIKYADERKPQRRVEVTAGIEAGWCWVDVRDNGVGIPAQALPAVFQRFTRAHAERSELTHVVGIGLGLAIVDDSVRALGGRIEVHSVEGDGTTFRMYLPATTQG